MGNGINGVFPPLPIPPVGGDTVKMVVKILKAAWDIITDASAEEVSKSAPVNESASLDDIGHVVSVFTELKEQARMKAAEMERCIKMEAEGCTGEIRQLLEQQGDIAERYSIRTGRLEQKIHTALERLDGIIDSELAKKISLDNPACRQVMELLPGMKKEQAMQAFWREAVQEALEAYCAKMRELLADIFDEIEEETAGAIDTAGQNAAASYAQIQDVDADNYKEETEKIRGCSISLLGICAAADELLGEG